MADSAPDPKVEDVLSSVRRLVSGELQRRTSRPPEQSVDPGALVLTSEQRVAPAGEKPKAPEAARTVKRSLEQRIAELEAAVDRGSQEFEPDGSEDQSEHRPDRIVYTRPPEVEEKSDRSVLRLSQIALIETAPEAEDTEERPSSLTFRHGKSPTREAPMAEDVPPVRPTSEVRAFSNPDDVVAKIEERIAKQGPGNDAPILERGRASDEQTATGENMLREVENESEENFEEALSEAIAAPRSSSDKESDSDDYLDQDQVLAFVDTNGSGATAAQPDEAPVPSKTETAREAPVEEGDATEAAPAVAAALDALPDEEAMRLLVGRLIREELQGKLGERITHNVRKLVRREIMRALESRDLI